MTSVWRELSRRNVFKVAVAYAIVAWLLVQVIVSVEAPLNLPDWTDTLVIVLLGVGFVVAVLLAWAYELTPEGVKRTKSVPLAESISRVTGRKLDLAIIALLLLAVGFMFVDNYVLEEPAQTPAAAAVQESAAPDQAAAVADRPSIAALPFANESAAEENAEFFANGIHDELLTRLAKIGTLKVISRTSVMEYRDTTKNMRQIGEELGVSALLEGRVQRAGDMVRINVQLIDAATDEHLWAEIYNRELTAENIFAIQAEMAISIAAALEETLSPEQTARLNERPTTNTRAYEFYLSGSGYLRRAADDARLAVQQLERAVAEDPMFALAWAALSRARSAVYRNAPGVAEERLESSLAAAERAFELVPGLPEAHLAMGQYYAIAFGDFERALEQYVIAERGMPGDTDLMRQIAGAARRNGDWQRAVETAARAIELDPRNTGLLRLQAGTYSGLRDLVRSYDHLDRLLEIVPDNASAHEAKVFFGLMGGDDLAVVRANAASPLIATTRRGPFTLWLLSIHARDFDTAVEFLDESPDADWEDTSKALFYAVAHRLAGREEAATPLFATAVDQLEQLRMERPENWWIILDLAEAMVGLGQVQEGERVAEEALALMPPERDNISGKLLQAETLVRVFGPTGNGARAAELLDANLSSPAGWALDGFLADPRIDPIRDDPAFLAVVEQYRAQ